MQSFSHRLAAMFIKILFLKTFYKQAVNNAKITKLCTKLFGLCKRKDKIDH